MLYNVTYMDDEYSILESRVVLADDVWAALDHVLKSDRPDRTAQVSIEIHEQ